jgi:hypothetical protein
MRMKTRKGEIAVAADWLQQVNLLTSNPFAAAESGDGEIAKIEMNGNSCVVFRDDESTVVNASLLVSTCQASNER